MGIMPKIESDKDKTDLEKLADLDAKHETARALLIDGAKANLAAEWVKVKITVDNLNKTADLIGEKQWRLIDNFTATAVAPTVNKNKGGKAVPVIPIDVAKAKQIIEDNGGKCSMRRLNIEFGKHESTEYEKLLGIGYKYDKGKGGGDAKIIKAKK